MQNSETERIKSARKKVALLVVLCVVALLFVAGFFIKSSQTQVPLIVQDHKVYYLDVARTPDAQAKGLGGRTSMAPNAGMLFWNDASANRCFWMKDMQFPLDIIWVSGDKHITHIEAKLSPSTYPKSYCADAQYVVELNAGEAAQNSLQPGDQLKF